MYTSSKSQDVNRYWQAHVDAWKSSSQSGAAYCKTHELVYHQFVYWRQKFCSESVKQNNSQNSNGFAQVVMPVPGSDLSFTLPNGLVIHGIERSNVALVGELLAQL